MRASLEGLMLAPAGAHGKRGWNKHAPVELHVQLGKTGRGSPPARRSSKYLAQFTVTAMPFEEIPFTETVSVLAPVSQDEGTSNCAFIVLVLATPILEKS